jgi:hypothetical protein
LVLAWIACAAGVACGIAGCLLLVTNPRRDEDIATATASPRRVSYEPEVWVGLVAATANDTLGTLRRLASRAATDDPSALAGALRADAQRFRSLRAAMPTGIGDGVAVTRALDVAVTGAEVEAQRLGGSTVVRHDRRAFLEAVRALRAVPVRDGAVRPVPAAPTASGDVAPSFTLA